jgi:hypothetical protein
MLTRKLRRGVETGPLCSVLAQHRGTHMQRKVRFPDGRMGHRMAGTSLEMLTVAGVVRSHRFNLV